MALTPITVRADLKCGNGAISEGEKCHKGQASRVKTAAKIALGAGLGALAFSGRSFREGSRIGHLTHGHKANPSLAGGLANAAVPAVVGAVAGSAITAGALKIGKHRRATRVKREADKYAHKKAIEALDKAKKNVSEEEWFDIYKNTYDKTKEEYERKASRGDIRSDVFIGNKQLNCGPGSKPCGNACIPRSHKCRASWNKPVKLAAGAAALTGAAIVGTAFLHPRSNMRQAAREIVEPTLQTGFGIGNAARGNWPGAAKNASNVAATGQNLGKNFTTLGKGYASDLRGLYNKGREAAFKARHHRPAGRRDTVWAEGFEA